MVDSDVAGLVLDDCPEVCDKRQVWPAARPHSLRSKDKKVGLAQLQLGLGGSVKWGSVLLKNVGPLKFTAVGGPFSVSRLIANVAAHFSTSSI